MPKVRVAEQHPAVTLCLPHLSTQPVVAPHLSSTQSSIDCLLRQHEQWDAGISPLHLEHACSSGSISTSSKHQHQQCMRAPHPAATSACVVAIRVLQVDAALALLLFQLHLLRRALETCYLMRYPQDAKMHGIAYVFGLR
jgi:hypothetical protein